MSEKKSDTGVTIKLRFPVKVDGSDIGTLSMRRPKVKDHKRAAITAKNMTTSDYEIHLFASLCGVPIESIEDLDMADYTKVQKAYEDFLSSETTTT